MSPGDDLTVRRVIPDLLTSCSSDQLEHSSSNLTKEFA